MQISNAIGKKICRISKQIFCRYRIGISDIYANFIQIDNLNEKCIIGADVLNQYNAEINFNNQTIKWEVDQKIYTTPFVNVTPSDEQIQKIQVFNNDEETEQNIDNEQSRKFAELLHKYRHIFSNNPGKVRKYQCQIKVTEGDPIYQRPYPIPVSKMAKMDQEIQRMLDLDIIEKSTSPWSSPIVGIEKKNGDLRVCLDARKINQRIVPDRECPMNIEDIFIKFEGAQYLSSIDLTAGYWQCPLKEECREITAFLHRGRNYQYKVLPFELINSVVEFQKILDKILGLELLSFVAVYVDDIHVMSRSFDEHHLEQIFQRFRDYNVTINESKSHFLQA